MNVATAIARYFAEDARRVADRHSATAQSVDGAPGDVARRSAQEHAVLGAMLADFSGGVDVDLLSALRAQAREIVAEWHAEDALLAV